MAVAKLTNTPNYLGALFNANPAKTQFLSLIGGTDGANSEIATAVEFPITVNYDLGEAAQPAISEDASMGAADPKFVGKTQNTNVIQIFQDDVAISEMRKRATGVLSGLAVAGQAPDQMDEEAFQIMAALEKMKRDMNYSAINGKFADGGLTNSNVALGTRGILEAIETNVTAPEALNADAIGELARLVFDNGAFDNPILFANSVNRQLISKAYVMESLTEVDRDRLAGGVAVGKIVTEFGDIFVATDNYFPEDTIALVDLAHVKPVFTRSESGAVIDVQERDQRGGKLYEIYAEFGLNHGAEQLHAKAVITPA